MECLPQAEGHPFKKLTTSSRSNEPCQTHRNTTDLRNTCLPKKATAFAWHLSPYCAVAVWSTVIPTSC